jgi:hypothetical protein
MNEARFPVSVVKFERNEDEKYLQIAFGEHEGDPERYIIVQRCIEPDEQDREMGLDGLYTETPDETLTGYELCKYISYDGSHVVFDFDNGRPTRLTLDLSRAKYAEKELVEYLRLTGQDAFADLSGRKKK